ncbi:MAG: PKD domain-containing protein, partial [Bacteroidota bacterium]
MKKMYPFLLFCFLISSELLAQDHPCGTDLVRDADLEQLRLLDVKWQQVRHQQFRAGRSMTFVPIQLHTIRRSNGTDGISDADYLDAFKLVNDLYKEANIHFYQCSGINYIDDDDFFDYDKTEMSALDAAHGVPNVINIYSTENVLSGTSRICGHAQFPGGLDFVMLANSCTRNGSTFAHELGHYFDLYHTHTTAFGREAADGSDCETQGDMLCDTPADPRLSGVVNNGCQYNGTYSDENGDDYNPDPTNIMSYAIKECRTYFSPGQLDRMAFALVNSRSYLTCGNAIPLEADFYVEYDKTCDNELTVNFSDATQAEATAWEWDFGDGTMSTLQSPSHTYNTPGVYDVRLKVWKGMDTDEVTKLRQVKVGVKWVPFAANFDDLSNGLNDFWITTQLKNFVSVNTDAAKDGNGGAMMEGFFTSRSPSFRTPTPDNAFESLRNQFYKTSLNVCIDARLANDLFLEFDLKQLYGFNTNYSNLRVLVDGVQVGDIYQPFDGTDVDESWRFISLDLTSVAARRIFVLTFEGSHKYDYQYQTENGNASFIDNISVTTSTPLPVEMTDFRAYKYEAERAVGLQWQTAAEIDNDYFEIEKSRDGQNWFAIGTQKGQGTTYETSQYRFKDTKPFHGVNYYRLRQVDYNGAFEHSDIRR